MEHSNKYVLLPKNGKDNSIEGYVRELKVLRCGKIEKEHFQVNSTSKSKPMAKRMNVERNCVVPLWLGAFG